MISYKVPILVLVVGLSLSYLFSSHIHSLVSVKTLYKWKKYIPDEVVNFFHQKESKTTPKAKTSDSSKVRLFTKEELWKHYRGTEGSKGLYLAFFGKVYDVSKGKQYYAPGGGYDFFAGRDGTKGFVTGDFSDLGLTDDLEGLDPALYEGFDEWLNFYDETYVFVGYLIGNFYDKKGNPTDALNAAHEQIQQGRKRQEMRKKDQRRFPMCNSESSAEKGSRVWCSKRSGGIERDWVGVPRLYHTPGSSSVRCACIRITGPPSDGQDQGKNRGDLDNPLMKVYDGCSPESYSCVTSPPK